MDLYTKDMLGREISVGSHVLTTDPYKGRSLLAGDVVAVTQNGVWVEYERYGRRQVSFRRINQVVA